MDTTTVSSIYRHTSQQDESQLLIQQQQQLSSDLHPISMATDPTLTPSPLKPSNIDGIISSYTTSPQQLPGRVSSFQIDLLGTKWPFLPHHPLYLSTSPLLTPVSAPQNYSCFTLDSADSPKQCQLSSSTASGSGSTSADAPTPSVVKSEPSSSNKRTYYGDGQLVAKAESGAYKCDHPGCKKSFIKAGNLISHLVMHSNERPYACGDCERSFSRNPDLTRHKRTHSGEKPHQCPFCQLTFARADAMARHKAKCKRAV
ncbi:hypothetical protein GGI17_001399 [Coemansia sp. S146]|nr:hypothetical protein GGI17_001399 [Coemansia sp. S146]